MENTKWTQLVEYINKKNIGDIILRSDLIELCENSRSPNGKSRGNTTTDNFRLWLVHCKYLESVENGKYKLLKYIKLSSSEIKKISL